MYDISILINRAREKGWLPIDVYRAVQKLPKKERLSTSSVYRVFQVGLGKPDTLKSICKVLGIEFKDIVQPVTAADLPQPRTTHAEHELVESTKGRNA